MEEYHFDTPLSSSRSVCVGSITKEEAAACGASFCDGLGYYLYVIDTDSLSGEAEVLARFASEEAAQHMCAALRQLSADLSGSVYPRNSVQSTP